MNPGGYSDYKYNLTESSRRKFLNKVDDVGLNVDIAYYMKRKKYSMILKLIIKRYLILVYHNIFSPDMRTKLNIGSHLGIIGKWLEI